MMSLLRRRAGRSAGAVSAVIATACVAALIFVLTTGSSSPPDGHPVVVGVNAQQPPHHGLSRNTGFGWVRVNIRWDQVHPAPGVWDFTIADREIFEATSHGLQVLAILAWVPEHLGGGSERNIPPESLEPWREYVARTAGRYAGQIAAYEIWNEPTHGAGVGRGIGWNRDLESPPFYADYLRAAAHLIRQHAPGTLVVGPAAGSRASLRSLILFRQLETTVFPEGPAWSLLDALSIHANVQGRDGSRTAARRLSAHLAVVDSANPSSRDLPLWITEFGWKSDRVGEDRQREYVCKFLRMMTGAYRPQTVDFAQRRITHAFIYKLIDLDDASEGIYHRDSFPKAVVRDYFWPLGFPATQQPVPTAEASPSCFGFDDSGQPGEAKRSGWGARFWRR